MDFTLNGKQYHLTREDVEHRLRGIEPEEIREYYVWVNGRKYPVKQVLGVVLRLKRGEFTTHTAHGILTRLGFRSHDG